MPSVAIVTTRACNGTTGGAERLYDGLVEAFRAAGWETVEFPIFFDESSVTSILEGYAETQRLNLLSFDLVVSTKAPTYAIWHPNHVCWLVHTIRVFYDRFNDEFPDPAPWALDGRSKIQALDSNFLTQPGLRRYSIGKTVSDRLQHFSKLTSKPIHPPHPDAGSFDKSDEDSGYLFTASRLHGWKRLDLLIEAVRQMDNPCELRIAGDGPERDNLERSCADLPNVHFLGRIDDSELRRQYAGARAIPFIPISEDYGYITVEAFLTGKPVITVSDAGEVAEIVRQSGGGVVADPNPQSLARALNEVCAFPKMTRELGNSGYAWATQLQWSAIVEEFARG